MGPWTTIPPMNSCIIGISSLSSSWIQKTNRLLTSCLREFSALMMKADPYAQVVSLTKTAATPTPKVLITGAISTAMTLKSLVNVSIHLMEGLSI